jgi:hypothetical protein
VTRLAARLLHLLDGPVTDRWPGPAYALRPFDPLADRRRWRWQRAQPCGHQVAVSTDQLAAAYARVGFELTPDHQLVRITWPGGPDWPDDWIDLDLLSYDWR